MTNLLFEPTFGELGVTCGLYLWLVEKRVADFLFAIIELFCCCYGWDVISTYWSKSAFLRRVGHYSTYFRWKRRSPPSIVGIRKLSVFATSQWKPHDPLFIRLNRVPACDGQTDGRTDRRNCCRYYSAMHCKQCGRAVKCRQQAFQRTQDESRVTFCEADSKARVFRFPDKTKLDFCLKTSATKFNPGCWRQLKMIEHSLKTILSRSGNQWGLYRSVGVMRSNFRSRIISPTAECKTDWRVFVAVGFIWYNTLSQ